MTYPCPACEGGAQRSGRGVLLPSRFASRLCEVCGGATWVTAAQYRAIRGRAAVVTRARQMATGRLRNAAQKRIDRERAA